MTGQAKSERAPLFDTDLLDMRRTRAMELGFEGRGDFLHREVAGLLAERLAEVMRRFDDALIIGSGGGVYRRALSGTVGTLTELETCAARAVTAGCKAIPSLDPLPLQPGSLDLVISALELHWANDPVGQLIQMRRALQPDGLMLTALFGGQTLHELRTALAEAEIETTGGLSPRVAPMGEVRDLGGLLQRAGYAMPVADVERLTVTYASIVDLMRDLRMMGETNVQIARRHVPMLRDTLRRAGEIYAATFPAPDGRITATFEIVMLTGWAPAESQPKPLRPGSAKVRLADALGAAEQSAGETANPGAASPQKNRNNDPG
ncbi:MAG: methyltransferase domain-containing protein [Pseudomonadota bacterium]